MSTHAQDPDPDDHASPDGSSPTTGQTWLVPSDPTARARAELRNAAPSEHLATILALEESSDRLSAARTQVFGGVEELTGLRAGELQTLRAVADGADHHRDIARRTGQADAAAAATLDGLVGKGMLGRHAHPSEVDPSAPPTLVHLTDRGRAVLGQSEAISVRLLDRIVDSLDDIDLPAARNAVDIVHHSLTGAPGPRQIGDGSAS